jgi:OOP family OmpA-OmpF porin
MYQKCNKKNLNNNKMTLKTRITDRKITAMMVFLVMLVTGVYSCLGQSHSSVSYTEAPKVKNAEQTIMHVAGVNLSAKAVALNSKINGAYEELKPALTPCGGRLYFSRLSHPDNTAGEVDNEDIWYSEYNRTGGTWSAPIRMAGELNNAGPNYINNVSVTGDTIILGNQYLKKGKMRAGLSYSVNVNGQWSTPKSINVLDDYNVSNHSNSFVSLKDGVIILAVERSETMGDRDLYVSFWNGEFATEPLNMGSVINTEMEESSPFLAADNKTLYFASKGHNGYGGSDIWVTRRLDDSWTNWSEPENLGPAVNSGLDDEFFSITNCGNYAVFSKQVSVHNVDLYRISMEELFLKPVRKDKKVSDASAVALISL